MTGHAITRPGARRGIRASVGMWSPRPPDQLDGAGTVGYRRALIRAVIGYFSAIILPVAVGIPQQFPEC
jgi:hypothetical protein